MFNPNKYETELEKLVYFKWTPQEIIVVSKKNEFKFTASKVYLSDPQNKYQVSFDFESDNLIEIVSLAQLKLGSLYTTGSCINHLSGLILKKALEYDFTQYDHIFQPEGNAKLCHVEVFDEHLNFAVSNDSLYFVVQSQNAYYGGINLYTVKEFNGFLESTLKPEQIYFFNRFHFYKGKSIKYNPVFYMGLNGIQHSFYQQKLKSDRINKAIKKNREYLESRTEKPMKKQKQEIRSWRSDPTNIPENKNVIISIFAGDSNTPAMYAGYRADNKFHVAEYELDGDGCISEYEVSLEFSIFEDKPKILWMELPDFD